MKRVVWILGLSVLVSTSATAYDEPKVANEIITDTRNFNKNLTTADVDVQHALDTIDDLILGGAETDPIVAAINGIVKSNGSTISAATAVTDYSTPTGTETFTNKRNTPRIYSVADISGSPGTLTPEIASYDYFEITALAHALNIANHSTSTPTGGEKMIIAITPDATPRALTYGTNYVARGVALPTTTVASKTTTMLFIWNAGQTKWNLVAVSQEG